MIASKTLADAVSRAASTSTKGLTVCGAGDERRVSWTELHESARKIAGELRRRGVEPSDAIVVAGGTSVELAELIEAIVLCGARLAMVPVAGRAGAGEYLAREIAERAARVRAAAVILDDALAPVMRSAPISPPVMWALSDIRRDAARNRRQTFEPDAVAPDDPAVLQFTSGTTAEARAVGVSHQSIIEYFALLSALLEFEPQRETLVSWLPLHHDMGLIGYLLCGMATGADLLLATPEQFVGDPTRWLSWVARFERVHSAGPSFAYALLGRLSRGWGDTKLSGWTLAVNGGEQIEYDSLERFCHRAQSVGFRRESMVCSYGLAEATLAVTASLNGSGPRCDVIDRRAVERDSIAVPTARGSPHAQVLTRLGSPLPCVEIRIVDPNTGGVVAERGVGEIEVAGTTVTSGYVNDPQANAALFHEGWLRTGDLGYMADGDLITFGRLKDVVIIAGRNIAPYEVERVASRTSGIRAGNVAAFGVATGTSTEGLVIVAEHRGVASPTVTRSISNDVRREIGVTPLDVVIVPPSTVPKTSSGKVQRQRCRQQYLEGLLR